MASKKPSAELFGNSLWLTPLDGTTRVTAAGTLGPMVAEGLYVLRTNADVFYMQGAAAVATTSTTGYPIFAKEAIRIYCSDPTVDGYVVVTGGTAWLCKVS